MTGEDTIIVMEQIFRFSAKRSSFSDLLGNPGRSWHEFGEAIDVFGNGSSSSNWLKNLYKGSATDAQTELLKYGLFKPMTAGNGSKILEDWHIQPIETRYSADKSSFYNAYTK